jgi:hypothetical protein
LDRKACIGDKAWNIYENEACLDDKEWQKYENKIKER